MKTRKQIEDAKITRRSKSQQIKPTKKQILQNLQKEKDKKKGSKIAAKKFKKQEHQEKSKQSKVVGRRKKQEPRVKPSPKGRKSKKVQASKSIKQSKRSRSQSEKKKNEKSPKSKSIKVVVKVTKRQVKKAQPQTKRGRSMNRSKSVISTKSQPQKKADDKAQSRKIALKNKKSSNKQDTKLEKSKSIKNIKTTNKDVDIDKKSVKSQKSIKTDDKDEKQKVKTVVMKGKVPIDDYFPLRKEDYHVLQYNGKVYSATLNQTNVVHNNNKFYILQILQSDSNQNNCYFFTRWGRVGVPGQNSNIGPMAISSAIGLYISKHNEKSKKGDYREIQLNYCEDEPQKKPQQQKQSKKQNIQKIQSKLPKQVQSLIELIFDINMMKRQMVQIGYNVNKMPLGKLSKQNIKKGYDMLKELYDQLKGQKRRETIVRLTNDFYSYIPHDFGFSNMSLYILDTEEKVKTKIQMLQALAEIKVATTLLDSGSDNMNKIDANYAKLNRKIDPVDRDSHEFKTLNDYLQTTHGIHHTSYTMEIVDLFRVDSDLQNTRYTKDIHNKMLLWHGSRLTNFVGILSQGLRIAPPQAPVTGYMFGKGVYFADMSSKSANYCFTSRQNNTGILLLCEVALGNMNEKIHADYYAANLPADKHSTKGVGKIQPDPKNSVQLVEGVKIPMGPGIQSKDNSLYLRYNQFIVYDIAQIKIKYILRTKFNYSGMYGGAW